MSVKPLLDAAYQAKLLKTLQTTFGRYMRPGEKFLLVSHEAAADAWTLSVTFENTDQSLHLPVELALVSAENPKLTGDEPADLLVDFMGFFLEEYFKGDRQVTLPLDWQTVPYGDFTIRTRGWEQNLKLERQANLLLAGGSLDEV
jgi:hypothetical protein